MFEYVELNAFFVFFVFGFWFGNTLFVLIWSNKFKRVSLGGNLVARLILICKIL